MRSIEAESFYDTSVGEDKVKTVLCFPDFLEDGREGPSALDDDLLRWLRKSGRPTFLVVNKTDGVDVRAALAEFSRYGFDDVFAISSAHRQGIDTLLAKVLERLPADGGAEVPDDDPGAVDAAHDRAVPARDGPFVRVGDTGSGRVRGGTRRPSDPRCTMVEPDALVRVRLYGVPAGARAERLGVVAWHSGARCSG